MAQKKKVSVSSEASKSAGAAKSVTSTRVKSSVAKKTAVKSASSGKVAATTSAKAKVTAAKPAAKTKSSVKSTVAKAPASDLKTSSATKPKAAATAKSSKAPAAKASPAAKAAASTKSKIAAAAQFVAARRAAAAKANAPKPTERPLKAVAAAAPATAKRSSPPVSTVAAAEPPAVDAAGAAKKPAGARHGFKLHEYIVYPAHGVGQIVGIEEQEIAGMSLELFVITFDKDKMTLRVPTAKVDAMRKLSESNVVEKAMQTLKGRARVKRTMWSRRAQEYENKINSGDLIFIAEVVRDLYRSDSQPEQSYSERQLYEAALDRMARELAAVEKLDERGATQRITDVLSQSAKGRRQAEEDKAAAEAEQDEDDGAAAA